MSQWLHQGLTDAGFEAVLMETGQVKAALKAMPIKTDRRDAEGIARLLQMGWFRSVHCKTVSSQEMRALLTSRKATRFPMMRVTSLVRRTASLRSSTPARSALGNRFGRGMTLAADAPTTDGRENPATDISRIVHAQDG